MKNIIVILLALALVSVCACSTHDYCVFDQARENEYHKITGHDVYIDDKQIIVFNRKGFTVLIVLTPAGAAIPTTSCYSCSGTIRICNKPKEETCNPKTTEEKP